MPQSIYPRPSKDIARRRRELAPDPHEAFGRFSAAVVADGALTGKTKQLIEIAVAHVTQCPYCIEGHTKAAVRQGATPEEVMETIWVAAEMRAGAAFAHASLAIAAMEPAAGTAST